MREYTLKVAIRLQYRAQIRACKSNKPLNGSKVRFVTPISHPRNRREGGGAWQFACPPENRQARRFKAFDPQCSFLSCCAFCGFHSRHRNRRKSLIGHPKRSLNPFTSLGSDRSEHEPALTSCETRHTAFHAGFPSSHQIGLCTLNFANEICMQHSLMAKAFLPKICLSF